MKCCYVYGNDQTCQKEAVCRVTVYFGHEDYADVQGGFPLCMEHIERAFRELYINPGCDKRKVVFFDKVDAALLLLHGFYENKYVTIEVGSVSK